MNFVARQCVKTFQKACNSRHQLPSRNLDIYQDLTVTSDSNEGGITRTMEPRDLNHIALAKARYRRWSFYVHTWTCFNIGKQKWHAHKWKKPTFDILLRQQKKKKKTDKNKTEKGMKNKIAMRLEFAFTPINYAVQWKKQFLLCWVVEFEIWLQSCKSFAAKAF